MRTINLAITASLVVLMSFTVFAESLPKIRVDGKNFVNESGEIIRFKGVSFSDPDKLEKEGQWTRRYFEEAHNWGCNIVRIPVHPPRLNERGWENYFNLLDKGISWAEELGMYVIIDWHSIGNLNKEKWFRPIYTTSWAETVKFWKMVAERYKNSTTVAFYELYNEPTSQGGELGKLTWATWKPTMEKLIDEINQVDDQTVYLVAGMDWGYFLDETVKNPVKRNNVAYVTHPYPQKRDKPWEPQWEKDWGHVADHYPIMATEFGFMGPDERGAHIPCISDESYGEAIMNYFSEKGISFTLWCFDPHWAPVLISDWNYTPSRQGRFFRQALSEKKE